MLNKDELDKLSSQFHKDDKAFAKLYKFYFAKISYHLLSKVNYDEALAEDLTSSAFEKAFSNRGRFRWQGVSFASWIYKIANNILIDYYRKASTKLNTKSEVNNLVDRNTAIEDKLIDEDISDHIRGVLKRLKPREQEIINLKFYEGFTNKSIAEELNISETNVGTILYRAMQKVKKIL